MNEPKVSLAGRKESQGVLFQKELCCSRSYLNFFHVDQIETLKKQHQPKRESSKTEVDQMLGTNNVGVSTSESKSSGSIAAVTSSRSTEVHQSAAAASTNSSGLNFHHLPFEKTNAAKAVIFSSKI